MTHRGQERAPAPHRAVAQQGPPTIIQRILLAAMVLFGCVVLLAVAAGLPLAALAALVVALAAGSRFWAGVKKKPRRQSKRVNIKKLFGISQGRQDNPGEEESPEPGWRPADGQEPSDKPDRMPGTRTPPEAPPLGLDPGQPAGRTGRATPPSFGAADPAPAKAGYLEVANPPVFSGGSAPGQAPWHLPIGSSPSGLAADAARVGDLEVRAASVVGAGHRCEEPAAPRQDAYALGRTPDEKYLIIAVADGVSDSPHSDLGARVAVSAATRELAKMLANGGIKAIDEDLLYKVVAGEMLGTGRNRGLADRDICSILIVTVIEAFPRPEGVRRVWTSWIGDVSLWIHDGTLRRVTGKEKAGLDRNVLDAVLPYAPDRSETRRFELHPSDRVAVMTDGLSDSLHEIPGVGEYFARQWAGAVPHPAVFLHSLCYDGPGQTDDRTAVVVWAGARRTSGPAAHSGRQP
jgi:serine/threonine protein phosphatase PrpC